MSSGSSGKPKPSNPFITSESDEPTAPNTNVKPISQRTPAAQKSKTLPDLGVLNPLLRDPSITEIMINDYRNVMVEREGKMYMAGITLKSQEELERILGAILDSSGKAIDPKAPFLDLALSDGSRVNIVCPPLSISGPCLTIRKFPVQRIDIQDLLNKDALDERMAIFIRACVMGKMNLLVSGGTGSGKTTLLNSLIRLIPRTERLVTIEDTPELSVPHENSVRLQTQMQTSQTSGVPARDLVANALRMRPDRIIIGECRRAEAFDILQAMNTGHAGSMTTLHANSPRDALSRLESLCMLSGVEIPLLAIRAQMMNAIDLMIHLKRYRDGKRRIAYCTEITGMEGEMITLQDIFYYDEEKQDFEFTGFVPTFLDRLEEAGIELPSGFFT